MAWLKLSNILHIVGTVLQAAHNEIPQDSQQKTTVTQAIDTIHSVADELAQVADQHGGSLDHETLKQTVIEIVTPILEELAFKAVEAALARLQGSGPSDPLPPPTGA